MGRIDAVRIGLAGGLLASAVIFIMTLVAALNGFAVEWLTMLKGLLPGFDISMLGSLVGAGYGFFMGFTKLFLLAFIYNLLGPSSDKA